MLDSSVEKVLFVEDNISFEPFLHILLGVELQRCFLNFIVKVLGSRFSQEIALAQQTGTSFVSLFLAAHTLSCYRRVYSSSLIF